MSKKYKIVLEDGTFVSEHDNEVEAMDIAFDYNATNQPEYQDYYVVGPNGDRKHPWPWEPG